MSRKNLLIMTILVLVSCDQPTNIGNSADSYESNSLSHPCSSQNSTFETNPKQTVKNVILMIGDGMGLAQMNAARLSAQKRNKPLTLDRFPVIGLVNTHSANSLLTDSAAAATAFASGHKTYNKVVGLSPDGERLTTFLEAAKERGLQTGLIATSSITHATPAAFATHVKHRNQQAEIARQLLESRTDILLGGGKGYFLPKSEPDSLRQDERDLIQQARTDGYELVETKNELVSSSRRKVLGLFAQDGLTFSVHEPSLAEMTRFALKKLSTESEGFVLIIEGSQIDWAAHRNEAEETIRQTLLFDEAIKTALEFSKSNQETLLIVTADHETGGMSITNQYKNQSDLGIHWATKHHTAIDVPLYAYGPYSVSFSGIFDNTCVAKKIAKKLNLKID